MSLATLMGEPLAPSWSRTFTMSIGWMMHVAIIPDKPPLKNGLTVPHAVVTGLSPALAAMVTEAQTARGAGSADSTQDNASNAKAQARQCTALQNSIAITSRR